MNDAVNGRSLYVYNKTRDTFVATHATVRTGLLGRLLGVCGKTKRWAQLGNGLCIVAARFAHTFGVTFPVDLVFLNQENRVVYAEAHVRPFRIVRLSQAAKVLELPPHTIYRSGTMVGDSFEMTKTW